MRQYSWIGRLKDHVTFRVEPTRVDKTKPLKGLVTGCDDILGIDGKLINALAHVDANEPFVVILMANDIEIATLYSHESTSK